MAGTKQKHASPERSGVRKDDACFCFPLTGDERQKAHEACALDGVGYAALVRCGDLRAAAGDDATVGVRELLEDRDVFVVEAVEVD